MILPGMEPLKVLPQAQRDLPTLQRKFQRAKELLVRRHRSEVLRGTLKLVALVVYHLHTRSCAIQPDNLHQINTTRFGKLEIHRVS